MSDAYSPIADYAAIGDCHSAALVSRSGSIDWYCPGRFDAPAVFCRLIDANKGGFFSLRPTAECPSTRRYVGASNVLETTFHASGGLVIITDFMPMRLREDGRPPQRICRLVECRTAACELEVRFKPTFGFAEFRTEVRLDGAGAVAHSGEEYLTLYASKADLEIKNDEVGGLLRLNPGEHAWFVTSHTTSKEAAERALEQDISVEELRRTIKHWEEWARPCEYDGPYREAIVRSALVLKLLTYHPSGAIVAAPTTSLPEVPGGVRNWDYRYVWLRDAALSMFALSTLGYHQEATDFIQWLIDVCGRDPHHRPQTMYAVDGVCELAEKEVAHLEGYARSHPVHVGNAASTQQQLDIFGDILSAVYHFHHTSEPHPSTPTPTPENRLSRKNWDLLAGFVDQAADLWRQPDSSIWEVRAEPRQFVYSKLMCWVALDRGIRLADEHQIGGPLDRWRKARDEIAQTILERGYNEQLGGFTQVLDGHALDASLLAIPRFGFLPATDPRVQSTIDAVRRKLMQDGLVYRYRAHDGLPGDEASFALCSFWMVDALALSGRVSEAQELFEQLLSHRNDVGLLSEEIDPHGNLLGNFPQGFSHMGLIGAAVHLEAARG